LIAPVSWLAIEQAPAAVGQSGEANAGAVGQPGDANA